MEKESDGCRLLNHRTIDKPLSTARHFDLPKQTSIIWYLQPLDCSDHQLSQSNVEKTVKSVKTLYQKERMTAVLVEFESENDVEDVISKTRNLRGTNIYVERDLNAERRRDKIIMLQLRKQLMEFSKAHQIKIRDDKLRVGRIEETSIIIAGDTNARIGMQQQQLQDALATEFSAGLETRRSKDPILNSKGKRFLEFCDDNGLIVLNGRTLGDEDGNCTYISTIGSSVNDIASVSLDILKNIHKFGIEEKIWSDHLPLYIEMNVKQNQKTIKPLSLLPKLKWKDHEKDRYQGNLNRCLLDAGRSINNLTDLVNIVKNSVPAPKKQYILKYKSKWFNYECEKARSRSFECLKNFRRTDTLEDRRIYLNAVKSYKDICNRSKIEFIKDLEQKLSRASDPKEWWKIARQIRGQNFKISTSISSDDFKTYFSALLNQPLTANDIQYAIFHQTDQDLDRDIDVAEIRSILKNTKYNKAPGIDRVPYEFYKNASNEFLEEMARIYNKVFNTGQVDDILNETVIFPIHKKGNTETPGNYRGISFMNTMAKVLMGVLNARISKWSIKNNVLNEYQAGFRAGYSTVDNIFNLSSIVQLKLAEKKKGIKKPFDI
ncbi:uncharacterized protein LOC131998414 [Stomoxys calcitrans]|uniref:uncharacterized protein LOC131998414 n=1 Tax=Stomoxys calcitrans TaxID=35570 RepID=UPI0027E2C28B|nr:uncharacterized protein LOC131998414 [Stomoxys calcitrans]